MGEMREQTNETDACLRLLIAVHAPHGFNGVMRAATDGCSVYLAATELLDALAASCAYPAGDADA